MNKPSLTQTPAIDRIKELEDIVSLGEKNSIDALHDHLYRQLIYAMYLGMGWVFPDGSWTPGDHWGGKIDYRTAVCTKTFKSLEKAENLQSAIDKIFSPGREYFTEDEYTKLPAIFRLFFVLTKTKFYSQGAMSILEGLTNDPQIQLKVIQSPVGYVGYADDIRSYTQEERAENERRTREREQAQMRAQNKRLLDLRKRLFLYLIDKGICPDCKKSLTDCTCVSPMWCDSIPF